MSKSTSLSTLSKIGNNLPIAKVNPYLSAALQSIEIMDGIMLSYSKILACRIEIKRLDNELASINNEAMITHKKIDSEFQIKVRELEIIRGQLVASFNTINKNLEHAHLEKMKLMDFAMQCQKQSESENNSEVKKELLNMAKEALSDARTLRENSALSLEHLIRQLPSINYQQIGTSR